jgi:hypothetical protein
MWSFRRCPDITWPESVPSACHTESRTPAPMRFCMLRACDMMLGTRRLHNQTDHPPGTSPSAQSPAATAGKHPPPTRGVSHIIRR